MWVYYTTLGRESKGLYEETTIRNASLDIYYLGFPESHKHHSSERIEEDGRVLLDQ